MNKHDDSVTHAQAMLAAWRARGEDQVNRVRFHFIEALARRASSHEGETRRALDARLSASVDAYAREVDDAAREATSNEGEASGAHNPLAALLADMQQHAARHPGYDDVLDYLRAVWSIVSAQKQVRASLAQVPRNAGPLNSNSLVHRALTLMHEVSPEYLQQFLAYVDALAWMEGTMPSKEAPRAVIAKKTARGKAR